MPSSGLFSDMFSNIFRLLFSVKENKSQSIPPPKKVLIIRQHNQFGDLLASVPLFRAVKETYPDSHLTVILSPANFYAVSKNVLIDRTFIYDKKKLINPAYFKELIGVLKDDYDLCIIPSTVSISFTSLILGRISDAKTRIGPASLNGEPNRYSYLVDRKVELNWSKYPDAHVSDFGLDIVRPFGIKTDNFTSEISFDENDLKEAQSALKKMQPDGKKIVGLHIGAGKPNNRWSIAKFSELAELIRKEFDPVFYITGSSADNQVIEHFKKINNGSVNFFINKTIPQLAALISLSDLFITNDTGVMHVAGTTKTPQISIFGPTNPYNWAPIGNEKYFVRNSDLIEDISVNDVYELAGKLLKQGRHE